jgi:hypothetical protein
MIRARNVNASNAPEKAMGYQLALYLVPDHGKTRVEFLSDLLFFHRRIPLDPYATHSTLSRARAGAVIGEIWHSVFRSVNGSGADGRDDQVRPNARAEPVNDAIFSASAGVAGL